MNYTLNQIPLFQELESSDTILIAGAGGGFDVFAGIPLCINLQAQGKKVIIGNFSFTWFDQTTSEMVHPFCYKVKNTDQDLSLRNYFPEKYLKQWFENQDNDVEVFGFDRTGVVPLKEVYEYLIKKYSIDTIILVDGGTDSLMFGDEEGLGTPHEDICSMAAVYGTGIEKQFLVSVGFGIDHYHGVSHYHFLENVAEISRDGGYLGMFQLTREMQESKYYSDAINYANSRMAGMESIVSNSIISALEGFYGDYHKTNRTNGSRLWINPLMTIYWNFTLQSVIEKNKYYEYIKDCQSMSDLRGKLASYRTNLPDYRRKRNIPL